MADGKLSGMAVGQTKKITVNSKGGKRKVTYKRIAKKGFPQYKILKNEKA